MTIYSLGFFDGGCPIKVDALNLSTDTLSSIDIGNEYSYVYEMKDDNESWKRLALELFEKLNIKLKPLDVILLNFDGDMVDYLVYE